VAEIRDRDDVKRTGRRRGRLAVAAIATVAGAALLLAFERYRPELEAWVRAVPSARAPVLGALVALICLPLIGIAGYLWSLGGRVVRTRMYPLPGSAVVGGARVVEGAAALRRGRALQALAGVLAAAGAILMILLWRLWQLLSAGPAA
jgi:hypothetical protein